MNRTCLEERGSISARNDKESLSLTADSGLCRIGWVGVFVAACCLLPTFVGCMRFPVRHGVIVKGDWSLEMNRIPWMKSRDNVYQQASDPGIPQDLCVPAVDSPFACNGDGIPSGRTLACGRGGCGSVATCESPVGYRAHARFHPVPTRPVFASEPPLEPTITEQTSPAPLPPVRSTPKSLEPPLPPETEVIPTPQASPESPKNHCDTINRLRPVIYSSCSTFAARHTLSQAPQVVNRLVREISFFGRRLRFAERGSYVAAFARTRDSRND